MPVMSPLVSTLFSLTILVPGSHDAVWWSGPILYIGPDQIMPFTSALAAGAGVLLMFWNRVVGVVRRVWKSAPRK